MADLRSPPPTPADRHDRAPAVDIGRRPIGTEEDSIHQTFDEAGSQPATGATIAGGIALINSIANLAGFGAPWALGAIRDATGELSIGLFGIAAIEAMTLVLILVFIRKRKKPA
ncbi:MAG: MFS transporter [Alphaproteobacteria bacterium]|nr:MFS transporter [Alphaproteobacteria bacterium]